MIWGGFSGGKREWAKADMLGRDDLLNSWKIWPAHGLD